MTSKWTYMPVLARCRDAVGREYTVLRLSEVYLNSALEPVSEGRPSGIQAFPELAEGTSPVLFTEYEPLDAEAARSELRRELTRLLEAIEKPIWDRTSDSTAPIERDRL